MRRGLAFVTSVTLASGVAPTAQPATGRGVVVETIGPPWSGAAQAGLRPGDVITTWAPAGSSPAGDRSIVSLAEWMEAEAEHGLRADGIRVTFVRDGRADPVTLSGGAWLVGVAPALAEDTLREHRRARDLERQGEHGAAAAVWHALATRSRDDQDPSVAVWFLVRVGAAELAARNLAAAQGAFGEARTLAAERQLLQLEREALAGLAGAALAARQTDMARQAWTDLVTLFERERPTSPMFVRALNNLARFQRDIGPLPESGRTDQRALDVARAVAPGSIAEVASLNGLALTARRTGNLADAGRFLDESATILQRFPASHPEQIANAANRGTLLLQQNRMAEAERQLRLAESLDRARGTAPDQIALTHHQNLGVIAAERGDLARAEGYFRSSLEAEERANANPLDLVRSSGNLAALTADRGDHARALTVFESTRALAAKVAPKSDALAEALVNLGSARARVGDLAGSAAVLEEALRLREEISPKDDSIAGILSSLASNAERQGDLAAARAYAVRAMAHVDRVAPGGLAAARTYHVAARILLARAEFADARRLQDEGLRFTRAAVPGSRLEAASLATLARIDVAEKRLDAAADRYAEAVSALALQVRRLGAALDLEAGYVDESDVQRPYIDVLLTLGRNADALEALERHRARAVLDRLASRDLAFGRSGEAVDLARERRRLDRDYDQTLASLARMPPSAPPDKVKAIQERLRSIRASQTLAASNLRRVDATLAEALEPTPLSLTALQQSLEANVLALVYHLGPDRAVVFALTREGLRVTPLAAASTELVDRVATWRRLVERGQTDAGPGAALVDESRTLYRLLVAPVEASLRRAGRVIVVPDGPLHGLSFAALMGSGSSADARGTYLAASTRLSVVPSLTARAAISARAARAPLRRTAAVFGDARYDAGGAPAADPAEQSVRLGLIGPFEPLPGSRREAERVAAILSPDATLSLGHDASEAAVKQLPRSTRILHIATHGLTSEAAPLESALVLSASRDGAASENGLLQAWEIFDQVRLDADLVVLSACDTGLGRAFAGEGLLGLTRAFQFAGARAVVASLWKAPDAATASLMEHFYGHLRRGVATDDALARAQRTVAARPETRHPFFWAGFVLDGDAR
jgi:CHAT domain-containing protein/Tfp pilus assembly protein PilF